MEDEGSIQAYHCQEIQTLQEDIAAWAYRLYGKNKSERHKLKLDSIAPLMGIISKLGELESSNGFDKSIGAIEDIFLYLCDFASREDILISHIGTLKSRERRNAGLIAVGKLAHSTLHYHRNLIGEDEYRLSILKGINELIAYLNCYILSKGYATDLILIFRGAWKKIRDKK